MIANITLENFKGFRKLEVNPRLITVFIGPNGSGKSSVLQAMALLKQSLGSNSLNYQGAFLSLQTSSEIIPKFVSETSIIRIVFNGSINRAELSQFSFGSDVQYQYGADFPAGRALRSFGAIIGKFDGQSFGITVPENDQEPIPTVTFDSWGASLQKTERVASLVEYIGGTGQIPERFSNGFPTVLNTPNFVLEQIRIVPPVRGLVRHRYPLGDRVVEDVSLSGGLSGQEEETASNLGYSRDLEGILSDFLKRVTGAGLRADTVPARSIEVKSLIPSGTVNIVAEGFGTNALILLFHQLVKTAPGATVLIEEPEVHLHPRAQAELASVLADEAKSQSKQIIMTTHSEHILGRLLTLVAEKKLALDELAIYAFDKDEEGVCTAEKLEVAEDGRVKGGLKDFFVSHLDELNRYVKALQTRE